MSDTNTTATVPAPATTEPAQKPAAPATPPAASKPAETPAPQPAPEKKPEATTAKPPEAKVVPEKYDLKLPEGALLDTSAVERIAALAKEQKLSQEEAQKLLERDNETVKAYVEGQKAALKTQSEAWRKEIEADPEIGGAKHKESVEMAKRVVERFGTEKLRSILNGDVTWGDYPELVRIFARIGRAMGDDKLEGAGAKPPAEKRTPAQILYGGSTEKTQE